MFTFGNAGVHLRLWQESDTASRRALPDGALTVAVMSGSLINERPLVSLSLGLIFFCIIIFLVEMLSRTVSCFRETSPIPYPLCII